MIGLATRVLAPAVGEHMARAAVRAHADPLAPLADHLSETDIDTLLDKLSMLHVTVFMSYVFAALGSFEQWALLRDRSMARLESRQVAFERP